GNRHPHGDRRPLVGSPQSVPDRISRAQFNRRAVWNSAWSRGLAGNSEDARLAHADLDDGDCRLSRLLSRRWDLFWLLPRAKGCGARSDRSAEIRMICSATLVGQVADLRWSARTCDEPPTGLVPLLTNAVSSLTR